MTKNHDGPEQHGDAPCDADRWPDKVGEPAQAAETAMRQRAGKANRRIGDSVDAPGFVHRPRTAHAVVRRLGKALRPVPVMLFDAAMLLLALAYGVLEPPQCISQYELERHAAARIVRVSELAGTSTGRHAR